MKENISKENDKLQTKETKVDKVIKTIYEIERLLKPLEEIIVKIAIFLLTVIGIITVLTGKITH